MELSATEAPGTGRTSYGYYRLDKGHSTPIGVLDNPGFPEEFRKVSRLAQWPLRGHAIFELLIGSGARVGEICEMPCGSIRISGQCREIRVRNKGNGDALLKLIAVTPEADQALDAYFRQERWQYDLLYPDFRVWAEGRPYTVANYLSFLEARGIASSSIALFITQGGNPYTAKTYRRHALRKLRRQEPGLKISPHHLRHWYVNVELDLIAAEWGDNEARHVLALQAFIERMGWRHWQSLDHYDHRRVAIALLKRYDQQAQGGVAQSTSVGHWEMDIMIQAGVEVGLLVHVEQLA